MEDLSNAGMQSVLIFCRPMGKDVMQHTRKLTVDGSAEVLKEFCCGWMVM
jgi:hypothetical protein